jgi:energy-coupling factor transporter ATP-binding protein EcfA2
MTQLTTGPRQNPATHQVAQRDRLAFVEIDVRKAPGISPGFTIRNLSPDVNIVYGPNASGKSTTARAIQALIWPHPSSLLGHALGATFDLDGDRWTIEADFGRVARTRAGQPAEPPLLTPIDDRGRYSLGLPDLLASENQPFAQAILKESTGGFDLEAIATAQEYQAEVPARLEAARDVETAMVRLRDAERIQGEIAAQERQLTTLRERERRARQASSDAESLRRALDLARARFELRQAERIVAGFPAELANATGDEPDRLSELGEILTGLVQRCQELDHALARATADAEATRLESTDISDATIRGLRTSASDVKRLTSEISGLQRDLQTAIAERESHQRRLAIDLSDQQIQALDTQGIRELAQLSHDYATIRIRQQARDEVERWIGAIHDPGNVDDLRLGIDYLNKRLQTPNAAEAGRLIAKARFAAYLGGLGTIAGAIWLAAFVDPLWLAFGLIGVLIILFAWKYALPASTQEAATYERRYSELDLPDPDSWTVPAIRQRVDALNEQYRVALVEQEKAGRWGNLEEERHQLDQAYAEAEARRADLVSRYGVAPDLDEDSLRLLAENLNRWQAADGRVRAAEARRQAASQEREEVSSSLREQVSAYGYSGDAFEEQIDDLEGRFDAFREAIARRDARIQELETTVRPEIERVKAARAGIYGRLGVAPGDDQALGERIGRLEPYRAATATVEERLAAVHRAEAALALTPHLAELEPEVLQRKLEAAEAAAELEPVMREIAEIQTRIGDAKRKRDIESALARRDTARDALRAAREDLASRIAGETLISHVRQETRDAAMPIVFHRARDLFTIITRGRYELQFEEGPPPAFTARDTTTGLTLALDQLSSGTRVQVLMAIRLSFVENSETGPKLPILLDETLGNSDELRAGAIIDAAIEISRNGRQVFYFTAQGDEVARWQSRLAQIAPESRPSVTVIDLAEVRRDAGIERLSLYAATAHETPDRLPVPPANGTDRATYGEMLKVPGIDPWSAGLGSVHLWHLITDMGTLQRLLEQDIRTWGQLTGLAHAGGPRALAVLDIDERTYDAANARARLIEAALATWQIGRSRPVTPRDIAESGIIPRDQLDAVAGIVTAEHGDSAAILERLRGTGAIDEETVDRLESWLIAERFLATSDPLERDEVRARALASATGDIERERLTMNDVDEVLNQLPR